MTQQYFLTYFYLYDYEADFISNLIKTDKRKAVQFKNVFRFIDDECDLNFSGEFSKSVHVIYPNELHLKCENHGLHASFLIWV